MRDGCLLDIGESHFTSLLMKRRMLADFIYFAVSMWHELRVVLHNRENTLLAQAIRLFAREERDSANGVHAIWGRLVDQLEGITLE